MVAKAGAGPEPLPHASLEPELLASAIQFCLTPEASAAAQEIAVKMQVESGVSAGPRGPVAKLRIIPYIASGPEP